MAKNRRKLMAKTDENFNSFDLGYAKALDMFRFLHLLSLEFIIETLSDKECIN